MSDPVRDSFDAPALVEVMRQFAAALDAHRVGINRLNVYPVPDGDTGTNMALTVASVVAELDGVDREDLDAVARAIGHGSLMGARGNSGVILSQILRGFADTARASAAGATGTSVGSGEFGEALTVASDAAFAAVMKPVEGTILTVIREASVAAVASAAEGDALVLVLERARAAGADALARTPELLSVLAEAGVVDAGGAGFLLLLDACLTVVDGRPLPEPDADAAGVDPEFLGRMEHAHADEGGVSGLRYEVMYFLEAPDETIGAFKEVWAGVGDSIVVVGGDGLYNCHIHTDDIGASIDAAVEVGRPRSIRVTDLMEQVEEQPWVRDARPDAAAPATANEPVATAVVAVATGDGIRRIFTSLGVQRIVTGGQTMNPSTAQLLEAVESAPADAVVVLPNNTNIIAVAEQVAGQTSKTVHVVRTRGVAEGFAALLAYDPEAAAEVNAQAMDAAADVVVACEVTRAVRDSSWPGGVIAQGDFLGICEDGIRAVADSLGVACERLLDALVTADHEIVTVIEGEGATDAVTRHIEVWLGEHRPDVDVDVHHGGQPLYPYLFGIE